MIFIEIQYFPGCSEGQPK